MRRDSRLSVALHTLLHMHELGGVVTSEQLAALMGVNPVVLRRTMGGLRAAGIVRSEKGHGGGWSLARALDQVTLADVHAALGTPAPFSIGPRVESPGCIVEQEVNRALGRALDDAAALLFAQLDDVSLAELAAGVRRRGGLPSMTRGSSAHV